MLLNMHEILDYETDRKGRCASLCTYKRGWIDGNGEVELPLFWLFVAAIIIA